MILKISRKVPSLEIQIIIGTRHIVIAVDLRNSVYFSFAQLLFVFIEIPVIVDRIFIDRYNLPVAMVGYRNKDKSLPLFREPREFCVRTLNMI